MNRTKTTHHSQAVNQWINVLALEVSATGEWSYRLNRCWCGPVGSKKKKEKKRKVWKTDLWCHYCLCPFQKPFWCSVCWTAVMEIHNHLSVWYSPTHRCQLWLQTEVPVFFGAHLKLGVLCQRWSQFPGWVLEQILLCSVPRDRWILCWKPRKGLFVWLHVSELHCVLDTSK